jgi:hypothetical protein
MENIEAQEAVLLSVLAYEHDIIESVTEPSLNIS